MNKRDLKADLEWLEKIRKPLFESQSHAQQRRLECIFLEKASEGWPHAIERAIKAEEQVEELLDTLMSVAYQECGYEENGVTEFDSKSIGARAVLLLTLIEYGRLEEVKSFGRWVIARLPGTKEDLDDE